MKNKTKAYIKNLRAGDSITIIFLNVITIISICFCSIMDFWWILLIVNLAVSVGIIYLVNVDAGKIKFLKIIRDWYWYIFILIVFKEIYLLIHNLQIPDKDPVLIAIDQWMFGVNPTEWIYRFAHPVLTEFLQFCYSMFYLIVLSIPLYAYLKKDYEQFHYSFFLILLGFYFSYMGYILVPAIGPRFTIHDFYATDTELPGLLFYKTFRMLINLGESIPPDTLIAATLVQRDCFPSGHTQLTLVSMYLSFKYNQKIKWIILFVGLNLIIATVYLRYHYVIDIIAGILFMIFTIIIGKSARNFLECKRG
jgi:membrane-associated phospholipid phosphatase